jgi:hypothetical protein
MEWAGTHPCVVRRLNWRRRAVEWTAFLSFLFTHCSRLVPWIEMGSRLPALTSALPSTYVCCLDSKYVSGRLLHFPPRTTGFVTKEFLSFLRSVPYGDRLPLCTLVSVPLRPVRGDGANLLCWLWKYAIHNAQSAGTDIVSEGPLEL